MVEVLVNKFHGSENQKMVQNKSQKAKKIKKNYFNSSIGQIEVVSLHKSKTEASKYCEENDGMLIPLHNQEIVEEVSDGLKDIKTIKIYKNRIWFHVGLDCKNGIYQWQDGMKFNGNNYYPSLKLSTDSCQNVYLERRKNRKKFKLIGSRYDYLVPFLCLRNSKTKLTKKSLSTTFTKTNLSSSNIKTAITLTEATIKPLSGNRQTTTLTTNSNKEVSNNYLLIGLSVGSVLLFAFICFIILKMVLCKRKKNKRSTTEDIEVNNASNNDVVDDVPKTKLMKKKE